MDILVRNVPDEISGALEAHAQAIGISRNDFIISQWEKLVDQPIVTERYAYRVYGKNGKGVIRRHSDHPNGTSPTFNNFSQEEADTFHLAADLIRRNGPGDREKAVGLLQSTFEEVVEVPA